MRANLAKVWHSLAETLLLLWQISLLFLPLCQLLGRHFAQPGTALVAVLPTGPPVDLSPLVQVGGPQGRHAQLERARSSVDEADPETFHLLPQHFRLRFRDDAVVRPHELVQFDPDRLPPRGAVRSFRTLVVFRVQPVLVYVRLDDRVGLDVDKVLPPVALDPQRQVHVRVHAPEQLAEQRPPSVLVPPGRVARPVDVGSVGREFCRYVPTEQCMRRCFGGGISRFLEEFGRRKSSHRSVGHRLQGRDGFGVGEVEDGVRRYR